MRKKCRTLLALLLALALTASLAAPAFAIKIINGEICLEEDDVVNETLPDNLAQSIFQGQLDVTTLTEEDREALRNANKFSDVPADAWYAEAVNAMASTGLLAGYEDGTFRPNNSITVGEWCTILMRIHTFEGADLSGGTKRPHWAGGTVDRACFCGFTRVGATSDANATHWKEDELVNRGEAITGLRVLVSHSKAGNDAYGELYERLTASRKASPNYHVWTMEDIPDHEIILANNETHSPYPPGEVLFWDVVAHSWDPKYILWAYNESLVSGVDSSGTCAPFSNLTRAEACQLLYTAGLTWPMDNIPHLSGIGDFRPKG